MELKDMDLTKICRICLYTIKSNEKPKSIFETYDKVTILGMLIALTVEEGEEDEESDNDMPSNICRNCYKKLIEAYEFQQCIVKSRKKIKLLLLNRNGDKSVKVQENLESSIKENEEDLELEEDQTLSFEPCTACPSDSASEVSEHSSINIEPPKTNSESHEKSAINKTKKIKTTKSHRFECELCDKVYTEKKALQIHFRNHTGERPYLCSFCSMAFASKSVHDKHVKRKHTVEGYKKHQCPYCPRKTSDVTHLKTHIQTHTGEKPDVCQICGKAFNGRSALRMHLRTHVEERTFKCRFCDQSFKLKKYLERHEMIHLNEKPHECHFCQKAFTQKADLKKHLKLHKLETFYICDQCNESFRLKIELRRHMIVHPRTEVLSTKQT